MEYDMIVCADCVDALLSRGERIIYTPIDMWERDEMEEAGKALACEWCEEETEDLYGVIWK